jgi:hypothetical protein
VRTDGGEGSQQGRPLATEEVGDVPQEGDGGEAEVQVEVLQAERAHCGEEQL